MREKMPHKFTYFNHHKNTGESINLNLHTCSSSTSVALQVQHHHPSQRAVQLQRFPVPLRGVLHPELEVLGHRRGRRARPARDASSRRKPLPRVPHLVAGIVNSRRRRPRESDKKGQDRARNAEEGNNQTNNELTNKSM